MTRTDIEFLTLFFTIRRWLIAIAVMQMLVVSVPAHAESLTEPATEPAPAISEPIISEPNQKQISQTAHPHRITGDYILGYFTDTGKMLVSPVDWDGSDWLKAGLVIGATSGLIFADAEIRDAARRNQSSTANKFAAVGNAFGNPLYTVPPLALIYLYCHYFDDPKARRTSLLAVESLAISGAFTWALKLTSQRPRPYTGEGPTDWKGPGLKSFDTSFPSGHTTAAFSIASVLAEEYGNNVFVPPIVYGLATLTGFARLYDDKHWASDAFFGGAIGYFVGKAVVRYHTAPNGTPLRILPNVSHNGFGLIAEYRFQ
jgi:membrane-associated phospholipid phosphatase